MAHFAQLNENNIVVWVTHVNNSDLIDENGIEQESLGIQHIHNTIPGSENCTWKQTSYNNNFRGRYASIGCYYDEKSDIFTKIKPFNSWTWNSDTLSWDSPIPRPDKIMNESSVVDHFWNEDTLSWEELIYEKPYPSWICIDLYPYWAPPIDYPTDEKDYVWNEDSQSWDLVYTG